MSSTVRCEQGYTFIELLIVLLIMSVIGIAGYINYKQFSSSQIGLGAVTQIQSILRLAQTNATSSTFCNDNLNVGPWSLVFTATNMTLTCGPSNTAQRVYTLENASIDSIIGSACNGFAVSFPFTITYSFGPGSLTFSSAGAGPGCLQSSSWIFTVRNTKNNSTQSFSISRGGAVNVK